MRNWYYSKYHVGVKALISHEEESFELIQSAISLQKPHLIVEFGSAYYGLTLLMHEVDPSTPLITFDRIDPTESIRRTKGFIKSTDEIKELRRVGFNSNVRFYVESILGEEPNKVVVEFLSTPCTKFVYMDNGNKVREVNTYAKYLREGDVLGVHDWGPEINYEREGIKESLIEFKPHPLNLFFEDRNLVTRMFVRT